MKRNAGFTLVEVLVVLAVMAIMTVIAMPSLISFRKNAEFGEAARGIASALREARSRAVSRNLEYRVFFNVANSRYILQQGNSSNGSSVWTPVYTSWVTFPPEVTMAAPGSCENTTTNRSIQFNPNGTANQVYICVMDGTKKKFRIGVNFATTGRVLIE